ncbi:MAG TPA: DUF6427 family protein, partial [Bacteroidales bacterium]|nr:DUF6427 family protein [Bacteroidales bacterium]
PLYGVLASIIGTNPLPGVIFSILLVAMMAFLTVNLNNSLFFINQRTFLPALIYILLSGLFPDYQVMNPAIFSAMFLMLAIRRIMDSYRIQGISYSFFDAGLLISTGSLFYANIIWFGILIIIGIALLRMSNLKEILIAIIGLLTPYALTFGIYYLAGKDLNDLVAVIRYNLFVKQSVYVFSRFSVAAIVVICLVTAVSIATLFMEMNKKKIQSRKTFSLLIWLFIISLAVYFIFSSVSVEILWITSIPLSYFIAHYLIFSKSRIIPEIVLTLLFLMIFLVQAVNFR